MAIPVVGIKAPDPAYSCFDFRLPQMGAIVSIEELRLVRNLTAPVLPAGKYSSARRHPEHRRSAVHIGAHEVPLMPPNMPLAGNQNYSVVTVTNPNIKPTLIVAAHISGDETLGDRPFPIAVVPADAGGPRPSAWADESTLDQSIQIELRPGFQSSALARSRHCSITV